MDPQASCGGARESGARSDPLPAPARYCRRGSSQPSGPGVGSSPG